MQTTPGPHSVSRPPGPIALTFGEDASRLYDVEPRRALALLRAVHLSGDVEATRALLQLAGRSTIADITEIHIGERDCVLLAQALRQRGQPLTDEGVTAFKMAHGFSGALRISPEVASTYARLTMGTALRTQIDPAAFAALDSESRRGLKLVGMMSHDAAELLAVARVLGLRAPAVDLGRHGPELATRLAAWARKNHMPFTNEGLSTLAQTLGWPSAMLDGRFLRFIIDALLLRDEPVHDYNRMSFAGCTLNGRTVAMLNALEGKVDVGVRVIKGSYEVESARGAHPHLGGGAADISTRGMGESAIEDVVAALREVGFAAWFRPREERPHIHAVAIGDREMSPAASWQVKQFFLGKDGRSRMGQDPHNGLGTLPDWAMKYRLAA